MKRVLSVSLGSSQGDYDVTDTFLGEEVRLQRVGTNSDAGRFVEVLREEDGKVDCFGFGGGDIWVVAGARRYRWRRESRMAAAAVKSPIVDGSGLKNTIERDTIRYLQAEKIVDFPGSRTLIVCAIDRFGIAEAVAEAGGPFICGDLIFGLGIPIAIRSMRALNVVARVALPVMTKLPQAWVYPTGKKQEEIVPKYPRLYEWADVICGDFHFIRRNLAPRLDGKVIVTNTTRSADLDLLRERGLRMLVTTTPDLTHGGRSPGTNVLEALIVTLLNRPPEELTAADYREVLARMGWKPRVVPLNDPA